MNSSAISQALRQMGKEKAEEFLSHCPDSLAADLRAIKRRKLRPRHPVSKVIVRKVSPKEMEKLWEK